MQLVCSLRAVGVQLVCSWGAAGARDLCLLCVDRNKSESPHLSIPCVGEECWNGEGSGKTVGRSGVNVGRSEGTM